ncbi:11568_t:CDS:2, partial [Diversispora eburnea]
IENNNDNITSFGENNTKKFEDCYSKVNVIRYQGKHTYYYQYNILDLENYPTIVRSKFRIPNGYLVQVLIYERDVICQTNYEFNGKVAYQVSREEGGKRYNVNSLKSASSTLSGVILFGLDLICLESLRENKENILPINSKKTKTIFKS